jgi:hypothetical protein
MIGNPILGVFAGVRIERGLDIDVAAGNYDQAHQRKANKQNSFSPHNFSLSLPGHLNPRY